MFESDYPHPETIYPDQAETVIGVRAIARRAATPPEAHVGERARFFA